MKPSASLDPAIRESILSNLQPFDPRSTSCSSEQAQWFEYFDVQPLSLGTIKAAGFELACYYSSPKQPIGTVIFVHGFMDHTLTHSRIINDLLDQNYAVLAADLPGHGFSSGERGTISDFKLYGLVLQELMNLHKKHELPNEVHFMGHSTGSAAIFELIRTRGKIWSGETILIAPLIRSSLWKIATAGTALVGRSQIKTTPRIYQRTSHDPEFLSFLKIEPHRIETFVVEWSLSLAQWVPLIEQMDSSDISLTVIQGTDDFTVGWRTNMKTIQRIFPNAEITILRGARHHLLNESEQFSIPVYDKIHETLRRRTGE